MKKIFSIVLLIMMAANTFAFRLTSGKNIVISQPIFEDLYISGGTITINAPIYGDLICVGGTIIINDTVMNDILIVGGKVTFNGFVGDDIRCAGGELVLQKNIVGDLIITGGKITINTDVVINELLASGSEITLNGRVKNNLKVAAGNLIFNGIAEKDIDIRGGKLTLNGMVKGSSIIAGNKIIIGKNASFNNNVSYWNKKGYIDFKSSIKSGNAIFDPALKMREGRWYFLGAVFLYVCMALLFIGVIQYLFSQIMKKAGNTILNKSLKSFGYGLMFFIAVPIISAAAFITIIGAPFGLFLLFNYIILAILASIISSVVISNWINNRFYFNWKYWKLVFAAIGIFIVLSAFSLTPFLGGFTMLILVFISFGAILLNINWKRKKNLVTNVSRH